MRPTPDVSSRGANRMFRNFLVTQNQRPPFSSHKALLSNVVTLCTAIMALFALAVVPAKAQFDSASVLGTVKDPSGAAIGSASVTLLSPAKGVQSIRQTDANGDYEFTNVQPGEYTVTVQANGFEKSDTDKFVVTVGARQRVDLALKVGSDNQTVTVSGAATLLETDTSDRGETIQTREAVT